MTLFQNPGQGVQTEDMDLSVLRYGARDAGLATHEVDLARVRDERTLLNELGNSLGLPGGIGWDALGDALASAGTGRVLVLTGWPSFRSDHADLAARVEALVREAQASGASKLYAFGVH
ncbi:barstar family protein [Deinococcus pimensis]|uniref:barstar family protein n=1 Tax=Deinococcus pimensis TaxID=309888 RepID=UPI0004BCC9F8|nr:barstar family protein [Deinococcus pimensis]